MKTRRWMKTLLAEAKKSENEIKPVWARDIRPKRCMAKQVKVSAAE
ncbi:MAG: hypothetical protein HLUCCO18_07830 [Rhodobacteraceae bacterium HLUCCO18]|nr:MAG: hypothetical protein HLUCCO18_07830 [Rhodobacteraceae bacterium HLUCCO18]